MSVWKPIDKAPLARRLIVAKFIPGVGAPSWVTLAEWQDKPCPCKSPKCRPGTHRGWYDVGSWGEKLNNPTHFLENAPQAPKVVP
jgi:hypothetical protein